MHTTRGSCGGATGGPPTGTRWQREWFSGNAIGLSIGGANGTEGSVPMVCWAGDPEALVGGTQLAGGDFGLPYSTTFRTNSAIDNLELDPASRVDLTWSLRYDWKLYFHIFVHLPA